MKYIDEIDIRRKKVLCRFDFNVPLDENLKITDDRRIRAALPTINHALDEKAKIIIISHLGRPKGKVVDKFSLKPVARRLERLLEKEIIMANDCIGDEVRNLIETMNHGSILLLENLRFHPGETANDEEFARELAALADIYVDDAFGNAHRSHASNVGITRFMKESCAGFLMKRELNYFGKILKDPSRPVVAIIGGSKVSDKLIVLKKLLEKVDKMIIGGGMAFTFLKSMGYEVGKSLVEEDLLGEAQDIMKIAKDLNVKLYLPVDCIIAERMDEKAEAKDVPVQEMNSKWIGLDIGSATIKLFAAALSNARTIVWNGPMGVFEMDKFSRGTFAMAHIVANAHALSIVGGGDTDVAVHRAGESDNITYISTGGGAFLQFMEGKILPAIEVLN